MIESRTLPSWDLVFSWVGEPMPRRGRARCPIHGGDSPTSVSVSEEKGIYFCHVCLSSGDKLDFVQRATGTGFKQALALLGIDPGMPLPILAVDSVDSVDSSCKLLSINRFCCPHSRTLLSTLI